MLGDSPSIDMPLTSGYAKEMAKWEALPTRWGRPGRPFVQMEYPKTLYKCKFGDGGIQPVDRFIVNDATEEANMKSRGYLPLAEAGEAAKREQREHGELAASREYAIRHGKHSEAAIAEIRAAEEDAGSVHLPNIPETPIKKRGRKVKV